MSKIILFETTGEYIGANNLLDKDAAIYGPKTFSQINLNDIIDLESLLQKNSRKTTKKLSSNLISRFKVEGICLDGSEPNGICKKSDSWKFGYQSNIIYNVVLNNAQYGAILTFDDEPQALLGFNSKEDRILITQNKGIIPMYKKDKTCFYMGDSRGLRYIKSNVNLMYDIGIELAQAYNREYVEVISAKNRHDFKFAHFEGNERKMWTILKTFDFHPYSKGFKENNKYNWILKVKQ